MPTLRKRPDGRYYIDNRPHGRLALSLDGRPVRDPATAAELYAAWCREMALADPPAPPATVRAPNPTLRDLAVYYLEEHLPAKGAADKTLLKSRTIIEEWLSWCAGQRVGRVQQLGQRVIEGYTAHLRAAGRAPKTVQDRLGRVRALCYAALDAGLIESVPVRKWPIGRKVESEIDPLSLADLRRVLAIIDDGHPELAPCIRWIAATGNRPSDACALTVQQVDLALKVVHRVQVKTKRLATYQISPSAIHAFEMARSAPGASPRLAFADFQGRPWTVHRLYHNFTRTLDRAEWDGPHADLKTLRHTYGYHMANTVGCPLPQLQVLMGHANIQTTLRYVRPGDAAASLERLAALLDD